MSNIEILSLVVTAICLISFCLVFTFLFRSYYLSNIESITKGRDDVAIIEFALEEYKESKDNKKGKVKKTISQIASYSVLAVVLVFFGFSVYSRFFNNNLLFGDTGYVVISSGSMSERNPANTYLETYHLDNQFNTYDIIGIEKYDSQDDIKLYDVVSFYGQDNIIYVHRVVGINSNGTYVTRGDSNNVDDTNRLYEGYLTYDRIIGHYTNFRIQLVGVFVIFLQSNSGIITIISIIYCLLMFDHFKGKYEEAVYARKDLLIKDLEINLETLEDPNKVFIYKDLEKLYFKNFEYTYEEGKYIKKLELSENELNKVKEESIAKEKEKEKEELAKKENSLLNKIKNKFNKKCGSSIDEKGNDTL